MDLLDFDLGEFAKALHKKSHWAAVMAAQWYFFLALRDS